MSGLLWLPARRHLGAFVAQVPALRRRLSTATRLPDRAPGSFPLLADAFPGLPSPLPTAALTRRFDAPENHDGRWLRVDPCHLRVEIAGVRMLACADLSLTADEASGFAAVVQPLFDAAGWGFEAVHAQRWYAQPEVAHPAVGGDAPEHVLGAYIDTALPQGEAGRATRLWLNELQMALHGHPLNRARCDRGQPEINSLWLHGDGVAPASLSARIAAVWSPDALVRGCAHAASLRVFDAAPSECRGTLVDARSGDAEAAVCVAQLLRHNGPVEMALASGERFVWQPWHRLRFWRGEPA